MIDIENDIYDIAAKALRAAHSGIYVSPEYDEAPAKFPAVTIVEADNRILESMRTRKIENAVAVMYEANICSNKKSVRKSEAKTIANTLDEVFTDLGFTRTFREQVPNLKDATVYRIVCRYEAEVGPGEDGKFLIYQNY